MVRAGADLAGRLSLSAAAIAAGALSAVRRIAPPLTVTKDEIDRGLAIMDDAIAAVLAEGRA